MGEEREEKVCGQQPIWFSGRHGLWLSRGCLLDLGAGIQGQVREGKLGGDGLWDPQMWVGAKEGCYWCARMRLRIGFEEQGTHF